MTYFVQIQLYDGNWSSVGAYLFEENANAFARKIKADNNALTVRVFEV